MNPQGQEVAEDQSHLPGEHAKREHVRHLCGARTGEVKGMWIDELRSYSTKQPL